MNEQKYDELRDRSTNQLEKLFDRERILAQQVIKSQVAQMIEEGQALQLTDEEERMLKSFRRFKLLHKRRTIFTWQTRPAEGLVVAPEQALIVSPEEEPAIR